MLEDREGYALSIVQDSRQLAVYIYRSDGSQAARALRVWDGPLSADELLSSTITLSDVAVRRAGITPFELAAVGIAASPHVLVCWELVSGRPVGLWTTPEDWPARNVGGRLSFLLTCVPQLANASERSASGLRVGGVESWLLWNLTQGQLCFLDISHDLADLVQTAQDVPLPGAVWPHLANHPGVLGRVAAVYLGGARAPVTSIACTPVAALYATGIDETGTGFIGYREEGYLIVRLDERRAQMLSSGATAVRPIGLPRTGGFAYAFFARFSAPQQAWLWLEALFPGNGLRDGLDEALFLGDSLVFRALSGRSDRVALVDVGSGLRPVDLFAAALRSMVLSVDGALSDIANGASLAFHLFADDVVFDEPALFAFQAAVSRCAVTVGAGDASGLGAALLAFVGADVLSPVKAREIALFAVQRERYDSGPLPAQADEWKRRWRNQPRDLL